MGGGWRTVPATMANRNSTRNTKNRILAMSADATAMPPKPNSAATRATSKNSSARRNMSFSFSSQFRGRSSPSRVDLHFDLVEGVLEIVQGFVQALADFLPVLRGGILDLVHLQAQLVALCLD